MKHRGRLLEVLRRAETGPLIEEKDFEGTLITSTVNHLIKEYGIQYDPETLIPCDDDMADRLYQVPTGIRGCIAILSQ
jgi:methylamine--corrinoid protein Co-methyltransferase